MTSLSAIKVPHVPAPNDGMCWKQDDRPGAPDPMSHCTFKKHHVGFCTWRRCAAEWEFHDVVTRCGLERGHALVYGAGHVYEKLEWAPGYPPAEPKATRAL